jgi:hypothetical protein
MPFKNVPETVAVIREQTGSAPTPETLDKKRCTGGGPPFVRRGRNIFYDVDKAVAWWLGDMSAEVASTSEYMPPAPSHLSDIKPPRTRSPRKRSIPQQAAE